MFIWRRRRLQLQLLGALAVMGALVYYNESGAGVHDSAGASRSAAADDAGWRSVNAGAPPLAMAMRHCAYSSVPDRVFTKDIFAQAMADPAMSKMFQVGGCKGGAYGGSEVIGAFKAHGFASVSQHEAQPDNWTVLWTQNSQAMFLGFERPAVAAELHGGRRVHNHCTLVLYAGDKCALARHMEAVRTLPAIRAHADGASGLLRSYLMNTEEGRRRYDALATMDRALHPEAGYTHMEKPCVASGASGQLFWPPGTTLADLPNSGRVSAVMQEYVAAPFLYEGGVKFHLRLYLVVTSYAPMRLALCTKGMVLRATQRYTYAKDGSGQAIAGGWDPKEHLTNSKVNAAVPLSLEALWVYIRAQRPATAGADEVAVVWRRIKELSAKLLCTHALSTAKSEHGPVEGGTSCFDVFGLDVILDEDLIPWVMEINEGPDMVVHDHWPVEKDAKTAVFGEVAHFLHNLLASRDLPPSRKKAVLVDALRRPGARREERGEAAEVIDALTPGTDPRALARLERWWALFLEHRTLGSFDRIYPAIAEDHFGAVPDGGGRKGRVDDYVLTRELCDVVSSGGVDDEQIHQVEHALLYTK
jgi:hypothetical protein